MLPLLLRCTPGKASDVTSRQAKHIHMHVHVHTQTSIEKPAQRWAIRCVFVSPGSLGGLAALLPHADSSQVPRGRQGVGQGSPSKLKWALMVDLSQEDAASSVVYCEDSGRCFVT